MELGRIKQKVQARRLARERGEGITRVMEEEEGVRRAMTRHRSPRATAVQ